MGNLGLCRGIVTVVSALAVVNGTIGIRVLGQSRKADVIEQTLDRYRVGDFASTNQLNLASASSVRDFRNRVRTVSGVGAAAKAAFTLEALREAYLSLPLPSVPVDHLRAIEDLLEDACKTARSVPAPGFTESWFAAAFALLQGPGANSTSLSRHLSHAKGQVSAGVLALAAARESELRFWSALYLLAPSGNQGATEDRRSGDDLAEAQLRRRKRTATTYAVQALEAAARHQDVKAEALLRIGVVKTLAGNGEGHLAYFDDVMNLTRDEWLRYLAHLLKGRALESAGQPDLAQREYEAALALRPTARSANLALAALQYAQGVAPGVVLDRVLDPAPDFFDPWAQYYTAITDSGRSGETR